MVTKAEGKSKNRKITVKKIQSLELGETRVWVFITVLYSFRIQVNGVLYISKQLKVPTVLIIEAVCL